MHIALVTHNIIRGDGQGRVNYELIKGCARRGVKVTVLSETFAQEMESVATWVPVRPELKKPGLFNVWRFSNMTRRAMSDVSGRADLVVVNGYAMVGEHDINVSHFVHGAWLSSPVHTSRVVGGPYGWYQAQYSRLNARWERQAYGAARHVIAVSGAVKDELAGIGIDRERIRVILNGVDLDEFHPGKEDRSRLGLPEGVPLALFVGDIRSPRKNLDGVLAALARTPGLHLAVVGAVAKSPYPALAQKLGLGERVHFLNFRRDVPALMRAADFFAFPSRYEACSLALLEALASGLPVITARTAGGCEVMDSSCGFVCQNPDDIDAIAAHMATLAGDAELRRAMSIGARRVAENYSWDLMADRYIEMFQQVAVHRSN